MLAARLLNKSSEARYFMRIMATFRLVGLMSVTNRVSWVFPFSVTRRYSRTLSGFPSFASNDISLVFLFTKQHILPQVSI